MFILVEINVEGVSLKLCEKASIYGQITEWNNCPIVKDRKLLTKEYLSGVI